MILRKLKTEVDVKCFKEQVIVEKGLEEYGNCYTHLLNYKGINYILKGFKLYINYLNITKKGSVELLLNKVYQEYYLIKAMCSLNIHIAKPLGIDTCINMIGDKVSETYVEIIFECQGTPLQDIKHLSVELIHNLMKQSATTLLWLHNLGIEYFDLRTKSMIYDSKENLLQFIDITNISTSKIITSIPGGKVRVLDYNQPEVSYNSDIRLTQSNAYHWAIFICSILLNEKVDDLRCEGNKFKTDMLVKSIEAKIDEMDSKDPNIKERVKDLLAKGLNRNSQKEVTLKDIVSKMREFEPGNSEADTKKEQIAKLFMLDSTLSNKNCATLECGCKIDKNQLVKYVLRLLLREREYKYKYFCTRCKKLTKLKSLTLDCGCIWTNFNTKVKSTKNNFVKCDEYKPLSITDLNIINDYISFNYVALMLSEYMEEEQDLVKSFNRRISRKSVETIGWMLKNTKLVSQLDLYDRMEDKHIGILGTALKDNKTLNYFGIHNNTIKRECVELIGEAIKINKHLKEFNISCNRIGAEGAGFISKGIKRNTTLKKLDIGSNNIRIEGVKVICEALRTNRIVEYLNIGSNKFGDEGAEYIGQLLKTNKTLTELRIYWDEISEGALYIAEALKVNKTLKQLSISCKLGDKGAFYIGDAFKVNTTITSLNIEGNEFGVKSAMYIGEALKVNKTLTKLFVHINRMEDEGAVYIGEALKVNKTLTELSIFKNSIGDKGAVCIGESLKLNTALKDLEIGLNQIGDRGAACIGNSLLTNTKLEYLSINDNAIRSEGALHISQSLKFNKVLIELNMRNNKIGNKGAAYIGESLRWNKKLTLLGIECNEIENEGLNEISEALKVNTTLKELNISNNRIRDMVSISEALMVNKTLKVLYITNNEIGDFGAKIIGKALAINNALQRLYLSGNKIGHEGIKMIGEALKINTKLSILSVSQNVIGDKGAFYIGEVLKINKTLTGFYAYDNKIQDEGAFYIGEALKVNRTLESLDLKKNKLSDKGKKFINEAIEGNLMLQSTYIYDS